MYKKRTFFNYLNLALSNSLRNSFEARWNSYLTEK